MFRLLLFSCLLCLVTGCVSRAEYLNQRAGKEVAKPGKTEILFSEPHGIFPGMPTPLQIGVEGWGLFHPVGTTVYGVSLNLTRGRVADCYGLSVSPLMNTNLNMYGISAGFLNTNPRVYGLSVGVLNACEKNNGVSVGLYNLNVPLENDGDASSWLQIGLFNLAENGLQIGLLNLNENSKIRILPLFNYSSKPSGKKDKKENKKTQNNPKLEEIK